MARYRFYLEAHEREELIAIVRKGKTSARKLLHALILLQSDRRGQGPIRTESQIAAVVNVDEATVHRICRRFVEEGMESALDRRRHRRYRPPKLDGKAEAKAVMLACSKPPQGRKRWTFKLLADKLVELRIVDSISQETVRRRMKANQIKPWQSKQWCIPPEANAEFVAAMEDVLDVYELPDDPQRPLVCMDEASRQLIEEVRSPLAPEPGRPQRYDNEYIRNGTANLFMVFEPLIGRRHVRVTDRRTRQDWALVIRELVDKIHPEAERITLVMDNLNTHSAASLYEAFEPAEARRVLRKLDIHMTPKHGSWLNMAEIELGILSRQCLDRRIPDRAMMQTEVAAWEAQRNTNPAPVAWRFKTNDARIKLRHLYPKPASMQTPETGKTNVEGH